MIQIHLQTLERLSKIINQKLIIMKKIFLLCLLALSFNVISQTKSVHERALKQHEKIKSTIDLNEHESEILMNECITYQENVKNLRSNKDSMEENEFHEKMQEHRYNFYSSFNNELNSETKKSSWARLNKKVLENR